MERLQALHRWVSRFYTVPFEALTPASADASFRRYFRLHTSGGSVILMDAPPEKEDCHSFVRVAEIFSRAGLNVPKVLQWDSQEGFMILTDFGPISYLQALQAPGVTSQRVSELYADALAALVRLQQASHPEILPAYDQHLLRRELELFPQWYVQGHLGLDWGGESREVFDKVTTTLLRAIEQQGRVFVHRDYHSRNLMLCEPNPGVLDFQDAVYGPVTYDVVSLLKDAYIAWDEEQLLDWLVRYWERARGAGVPVDPDFGAFYQDFEWMGVQRHLKVLGIFARLCQRDGKTGYLADMPRVAQYLTRTCRRYKELQLLGMLLEKMWEIETVSGLTF
ncbi:MAG: phosphotransferase [Ferrovum sp.]|nr:phosphotransferase [Ferrovum sp.]NDU88203.1 phosphotransferase [Ferrovum sp.]